MKEQKKKEEEEEKQRKKIEKERKKLEKEQEKVRKQQEREAKKAMKQQELEEKRKEKERKKAGKAPTSGKEYRASSSVSTPKQYPKRKNPGTSTSAEGPGTSTSAESGTSTSEQPGTSTSTLSEQPGTSSDLCAVCFGAYNDDIDDSGDITADWIQCADAQCAVWSHVNCLEREVGGFVCAINFALACSIDVFPNLALL